jgi:hypothetical protein
MSKFALWPNEDEMIGLARRSLIRTAGVRHGPPTRIEAVAVLAAIALREAFGIRPPRGELILGLGYSELVNENDSQLLARNRPNTGRLDKGETLLFATDFGTQENYRLSPTDPGFASLAPLLVAYNPRQRRSILRWRGADGDRCLVILPFSLEPDNAVTAAYTAAERQP